MVCSCRYFVYICGDPGGGVIVVIYYRQVSGNIKRLWNLKISVVGRYTGQSCLFRLDYPRIRRWIVGNNTHHIDRFGFSGRKSNYTGYPRCMKTVRFILSASHDTCHVFGAGCGISMIKQTIRFKNSFRLNSIGNCGKTDIPVGHNSCIMSEPVIRFVSDGSHDNAMAGFCRSPLPALRASACNKIGKTWITLFCPSQKYLSSGIGAVGITHRPASLLLSYYILHAYGDTGSKSRTFSLSLDWPFQWSSSRLYTISI